MIAMMCNNQKMIIFLLKHPKLNINKQDILIVYNFILHD